MLILLTHEQMSVQRLPWITIGIMMANAFIFLGLRGFVWVSPDGKQCNSLCGKGIQTSSGAEKWSIFRIG